MTGTFRTRGDPIMTNTPSPATVSADPEGDEIVYAARITRELAITDRCLRKWVRAGRFPEPDANINGRNVWRLGTYRRWKTAMLAGSLRQDRRPSHLRKPVGRAA
jgi:hypothetical protein